MPAGQGHETTFAQVIGEWLGVESERVRLITGDTDRMLAGGRLVLCAIDADRIAGHSQGRRHEC